MNNEHQNFIRLSNSDWAAIQEDIAPGEGPFAYTNPNLLVRELFWRRLEKLLALSRPPKRARVMDFGGGNGVLLPTLSTMFESIYCVDINIKPAHDLAKRNSLSKVSCLQGDLKSLAFPSCYFDTITATDVLEHLPAYDHILEEFRRILVPGGELLISSPTENRLYEIGRKIFGYNKPPDHYHTADEINRKISGYFYPTQEKHFPLNNHTLGIFSLARFVKQ